MGKRLSIPDRGGMLLSSELALIQYYILMLIVYSIFVATVITDKSLFLLVVIGLPCCNK